MTNIATAVIELLAEAGVRHVFGAPSGPWAPIWKPHGASGVCVDEYRSSGWVYGDCLWHAHRTSGVLLWHVRSGCHESVHGGRHGLRIAINHTNAASGQEE
jgi:hypothetical protein